MKIYNNNENFGYCGPFEAESIDALVAEMMPTLRDWADEKSVSVESLEVEYRDGLEIIDAQTK